MAQSLTSYEELMRQVETLKAENSHLRRELEGNANHQSRSDSDSTSSHGLTAQSQFIPVSVVGQDRDGLPAETAVTAAKHSEVLKQISSGNRTHIMDIDDRTRTMNLKSSDEATDDTERSSIADDTTNRVSDLTGSSYVSHDHGSPPDERPSPGAGIRRGLHAGRQDRTSRNEIDATNRQRQTMREAEKEENDGEIISRMPVFEVNSKPVSVGRVADNQLLEHITAQTTDSLHPLTCGDDTDESSSRAEVYSRHAERIQSQSGFANNPQFSNLYHGVWPIEKGSLNEISRAGSSATALSGGLTNQETVSIMSFASSSAYRGQPQQLGNKVEMVYSLLSMLGTHDGDDMSRTLLAMSNSQDSCVAMRQSGCIPLLVQLLHGNRRCNPDGTSDLRQLGAVRGSRASRSRAAVALQNIVRANPDSDQGRREVRVLQLLSQIRSFCDRLRSVARTKCVNAGLEDEEDDDDNADDSDVTMKFSGQGDVIDSQSYAGPAVAALMKLSFTEEHRSAMCSLGGIEAIAELLDLDHTVSLIGVSGTTEESNVTMRRYACMALTNLTFGDGANKALFCSLRGGIEALVSLLDSGNGDLVQDAASVLRNLSWRTDMASKNALRAAGAVGALIRAALDSSLSKETTLKSVLSALWNVSAHSSENKAEICAVEGALDFIVMMLTYRSPSGTLFVVENAGGILRMISSHVALREDYRAILRRKGCLQILLHHLQSSSLTIVSNACGTLWNLSARCVEDQRALWDLGAPAMLRNLVHSRHRMIAMGSAAALKNLLSGVTSVSGGPSGISENSPAGSEGSPRLQARRRRSLEAELDARGLTETCENIDSPPREDRESRLADTSSGSDNVFTNNCRSYDATVAEILRNIIESAHRSGSKDSVGSTHSDISHDRMGHRSFMDTYSNDVIAVNGYDAHQRQRGEDDVTVKGPVIESSSHSGINTKQHSLSQSGVVAAAGDLPSRLMDPHAYTRGPHSAESSPLRHRRMQMPRSTWCSTSGVDTSLTASKPLWSGRGGSGSDGSTGASFSGANGAVDNGESVDELMDFSRLSQCMERLHMNVIADEEEDDLPIDFSKKYFDSRPHLQLSQQELQPQQHTQLQPLGSMQQNVCHVPFNSSVHQSFHAQPLRKAATHSIFINSRSLQQPGSSSKNHPPQMQKNNLVYSGAVSQRTPFTMSKAQPTIIGSHANITVSKNSFSNKTPNSATSQRASLDNNDPAADTSVDQPTDFSSRFAEDEVEEENVATGLSDKDQPIDYSKQYTQGNQIFASIKVHKTGTVNGAFSLVNGASSAPSLVEDRKNCQPQRHMLSGQRNVGTPAATAAGTENFCDDTIQTFCTEGTPLNFLSTATSLTDLSGRNHFASNEQQAVSGGLGPQARIISQKASKNAESQRHQPSELRNPNNDALRIASGPGLSEMTASASMKVYQASGVRDGTSKVRIGRDEDSDNNVTTYATEGTPNAFSRVSSLSSVGPSRSRDEPSNLASGRPSSSINNDKSLNASLMSSNRADSTMVPPDVCAASSMAKRDRPHPQEFLSNTGEPSSHDGGGGSAGKTVTFDDHHQVQETPMMFSRCSSLGSLSSFDAHSVHSSVISEYSRRASEVVSPSDLPDSPGATMPSSPGSAPKISGAGKFSSGSRPGQLGLHPVETTVKKCPPAAIAGNLPVAGGRTVRLGLLRDRHVARNIADDAQFSDDQMLRPMVFDEDDDTHNRSSAVSPGGSMLSALTIDDDLKPIDLVHRRILPAKEEPVLASSGKVGTETAVLLGSSTVNTNRVARQREEEEEDDSSVSEGEEVMLAEVISLAMPRKSSSSRRSMVRSRSDGLIRRKPHTMATPAAGNLTSVTGREMLNVRSGVAAPPGSHFDDGGIDSPRRFATEDTPLNYSRSESPHAVAAAQREEKSEIIKYGSLAADKPCNGDTDAAVDSFKQGSSDSSVSSLSDSDENFDLLSEVIEAAMPKSSKKNSSSWKSASTAAGPVRNGATAKFGSTMRSDSTNHTRESNCIVATVPSTNPLKNSQITTMTLVTGTAHRTRSADATSIRILPQRYAQRDQYSYSTSQTRRENAAYNSASSGVSNTVMVGNNHYGRGDGCEGGRDGNDMVQTYAVEGTPVNFSRSTSLSNLTIESDASAARGIEVTANRRAVSGRGVATNVPCSMTSPWHSEQIGSNRGRVATRAMSVLEPSEDTTRAWCVVEGTPVSFSRNDSLSSLSDEDDARMSRQLRNHGISQTCSRRRDEIINAQARVKSVESAKVNRLSAAVLQNGPGSTSTPLGNKSSHSHRLTTHIMQPMMSDDHVTRYNVEDTPAISRNLSPNGAGASSLFGSPLSALSIESLSLEPSEAALLEECINAAMPKSKHRSKSSKGSTTAISSNPRPMRTSPTVDKTQYMFTAHKGVHGVPVVHGGTSNLVMRSDEGRHREVTDDHENRKGTVNKITNKDSNTPGHPRSGLQNIASKLNSRCEEKIRFMDSICVDSLPAEADRSARNGNSRKSGINAMEKHQQNMDERAEDKHFNASPLTMISSSVFSSDAVDYYDDDVLASGPSTEANNTVIYRGVLQESNLPDSDQVNAESQLCATSVGTVEVAIKRNDEHSAGCVDDNSVAIREICVLDMDNKMEKPALSTDEGKLSDPAIEFQLNEEQVLEENAKLVISELRLKFNDEPDTALSAHIVQHKTDDDTVNYVTPNNTEDTLFVENNAVLISPELDISFSETSNTSYSTCEDAIIKGKSKGSPRIVKPGANECDANYGKSADDGESAKAIRGGKRRTTVRQISSSKIEREVVDSKTVKVVTMPNWNGSVALPTTPLGHKSKSASGTGYSPSAVRRLSCEKNSAKPTIFSSPQAGFVRSRSNSNSSTTSSLLNCTVEKPKLSSGVNSVSSPKTSPLSSPASRNRSDHSSKSSSRQSPLLSSQPVCKASSPSTAPVTLKTENSPNGKQLPATSTTSYRANDSSYNVSVDKNSRGSTLSTAVATSPQTKNATNSIAIHLGTKQNSDSEGSENSLPERPIPPVKQATFTKPSTAATLDAATESEVDLHSFSDIKSRTSEKQILSKDGFTLIENSGCVSSVCGSLGSSLDLIGNVTVSERVEKASPTGIECASANSCSRDEKLSGSPRGNTMPRSRQMLTIKVDAVPVALPKKLSTSQPSISNNGIMQVFNDTVAEISIITSTANANMEALPHAEKKKDARSVIASLWRRSSEKKLHKKSDNIVDNKMTSDGDLVEQKMNFATAKQEENKKKKTDDKNESKKEHASKTSKKKNDDEAKTKKDDKHKDSVEHLLGKSPKSFRKSFPLVRRSSKKRGSDGATTNRKGSIDALEISNDILTRSSTYDKIDSVDTDGYITSAVRSKIGLASSSHCVNRVDRVKGIADDELEGKCVESQSLMFGGSSSVGHLCDLQITIPMKNACGNDINNETSQTSTGQDHEKTSFKKHHKKSVGGTGGIFRRKEKSKETIVPEQKTAKQTNMKEKDKKITEHINSTGAIKKKGFSLWRKDDSSGARSKLQKEVSSTTYDNVPMSSDEVWVRSPESSPNSKATSPTNMEGVGTPRTKRSTSTLLEGLSSVSSSNHDIADIDAPFKHSTKTEMLLARHTHRHLSGGKSDSRSIDRTEFTGGESDDCPDEEPKKQGSCLITTV